MADTAPEYVAARAVLLDALFALAPHGKAVIVAGAQAIYLHTGANDIGVAPYTTDGDLALDPSIIGEEPELEAAMRTAGFDLNPAADRRQPGIWSRTVDIGGVPTIVPVDLLVPEAVAGSGSRSAKIPPHGKMAARRSPGLEAVLVDHTPMTISALDPSDDRSITVEVAGLAAMLVAKAHKISDRLAEGRLERLGDKDAADVYRIMQTANLDDLAATFTRLLADPMAGAATAKGVELIRELLGTRRGDALPMAHRSLALSIAADQITAVSIAFTNGLLDRIG